MKLIRTTALTAALMTAAVPSLTTPANAWGWGWGVYRITAISATPLITAMVSPTRLMAMVMGAATTAVTDTPITPLSAAISMPALWVSGVTGATKEPTRVSSLL